MIPVLLRRQFSSRAAVWASAQRQLLGASLAEADPAMASIVAREETRQRQSVNLIASENYTSLAVRTALGSVLQNKYSEGLPGTRYYPGNAETDASEELCQTRALELFKLSPDEWGVNVQSLSGAPANLYALSAVMDTNDRLMGLDLPCGGHLSHGYQTPSKKISFVSKYFQSIPYRTTADGIIDYDELATVAQAVRPKVIIAGASAYSRLIDYARMREIADASGAYLLSDIAHIAGPIAAGVIPSPFASSDIVTTTSHKSLRGPRGALIFYRKGTRSFTKKGEPIEYDLESRINFSVFPGHQGGPHNHTIAALAVALGQAMTPAFVEYQRQVVANAQAFATALLERGYKLVSNGTENHLVLIDLKPHKIDGARVEFALELIGIDANKNTVPGDRSAMVPGGVRAGTPAMTTREFKEPEFAQVAEYFDRAVKAALRIKGEVAEIAPKPKLVDFKVAAVKDDELADLRKEVTQWVAKFPVPGDA